MNDHLSPEPNAPLPTMDAIRQAIEEHQIPPAEQQAESSKAAVALIISGEPADPTLCFIRRAEHESDPWSGHMAFPGGRVESSDVDPHAAAIRETWEEIGLDLAQSEEMGPLLEMPVFARGQPTGMTLYSFLFFLPGTPPQLELNREVAEVYWPKLSFLIDQKNWDQIHYQRKELDLDIHLPTIRLGEQHIWGLTYRMLRQFLDLLNHPLPEDPFEKGRGH